MNEWLVLILGALATYRLALLFSLESGPGRIFKKLRNVPPPKSATREGIACFYCESVWMSAPIALFFWLSKRIEAKDMWLYWLGFSALAVILHRAFTKTFKR
jgi:hypothetical protein